MKYKALVSFAGKISMGKGEVMEISNQMLISDLLKAKYIEPAEVVEKEITEVTEEITPTKKSKSKK